MIEATTELQELMKVEKNIITPQSSSAVVTLVQDATTSMYLLTGDKRAAFTPSQAMNLYMSIATPQQPYKQDWLKGRQIFSYLLPDNFAWSYGAVRILNGEVQECGDGISSKEMGQLIQALYNWNGFTEKGTMHFISDAQRLGLSYFGLRGFSTGLIDTDDYKKRVKTEKGSIKIPTDYDENRKLQYLDTISTTAGAEAQKALRSDNSMKAMLESGAKGKPSNIQQMSACVGQQIVIGERPSLGFSYSQRTLPHFTKQETEELAEARGFIESNFRDGLNSTEFFFAAQGGREGMTDTSCATQDVGHVTRRLTKQYENIKVCEDLSVRDDKGNMYQFKYGDDNYDPMKVRKTGKKLALWIAPFKVPGYKKWEGKVLKLHRKLKRNFQTNVDVKMPVNMTEFLARYRKEAPKEKRPLGQYFRSLMPVVSRFILPFRAYVVHELRPDVATQYDLKTFQQILMGIKRSYQLALINPGEAVGNITAQSLGQVGMQATLNRFHHSGLASATSSGFQKMKRLFDASKKASNSSRLFFNEPQNLQSVQEVARRLKTRLLENVVETMDVVYGIQPEDENWVGIWREVYKDTIMGRLFASNSHYSKFAGRFKINTRYTTAKHVQSQLFDLFGDLVFTICSHDVVLFFVPCACFADDDDTASEHVPAAFMEKLTTDLGKALQISGLPNVDLVTINWGVDKTLASLGKFDSNGEYYLDMEGGELIDAIILDDRIDGRRSYSSNPVIAQYNLGIEGAAAVLKSELNKILEETSHVDHHHVNLVVDWMAHNQVIVALSRHTQNLLRVSGPLDRSSNEQGLSVLIEAALNNRIDDMTGISARIMAGSKVRVGTGAVDVLQPAY